MEKLTLKGIFLLESFIIELFIELFIIVIQVQLGDEPIHIFCGCFTLSNKIGWLTSITYDHVCNKKISLSCVAEFAALVLFLCSKKHVKRYSVRSSSISLTTGNQGHVLPINTFWQQHNSQYAYLKFTVWQNGTAG